MHLARTSISTLPRPHHSALVLTQPDNSHFVLATDAGFELWQTHPLRFVLRRELPGSLSHASVYGATSLFFLVGGGPAPVFAPNKVVLWDEAQGAAVLELEFREKVLGLASRPGLLAVVFLRRVVLFKINDLAPTGDGEVPGSSGSGAAGAGKGKEREALRPTPGAGTGGTSPLSRVGEWPTSENSNGLIAMSSAPGSSLVAIPGRQAGHVHLLHVHPVPTASEPASTTSSASHAPPRSQILIAHTTALSTLATTPSGSHLSTTSSKGTLVRIFSPRTGALVRELRRGADRAVLRQGGVGLSADGRWVGAWSDKGTVHAFSLDDRGKSGSSGTGLVGSRGGGTNDERDDQSRNRPSTLSRLLPYLPAPLQLPKYFHSEWSHASYALPRVEKHNATLASLGTTLARGAAKAAAAAAASAGGGESGGQGAERERRPEPNGEDDEDERCVLAWIKVDPRAESQVKRLRARTASSAASSTPVKPTRRWLNGRSTLGVRSGDSDDEAGSAERPVHLSTLPAPSVPPSARMRASGPLHMPHRRDVLRPVPHRRPHHGERTTSSGFKHHDAPSSSPAPAAAAASDESASEHQLVALTFSGGFYRLALPSSASSAPSGPSSTAHARTSSLQQGRPPAHRRSSDDPAPTSGDEGAARGDGAGGLRLAEYRRFGEGGWGFVFPRLEDGREWNEGGW